MAQFYASIQGNRGEATRMGSKSSGLRGHIRGWRVGARVVMRYNEETKQDECLIYLTSGSNGFEGEAFLGKFTAGDIGEICSGCGHKAPLCACVPLEA